MLDMIERYVDELSQANGYSYVYSYSFGGNLIYGAKPYDITTQVVAGLNEKFKQGTELNNGICRCIPAEGRFARGAY